MDRSRTVGPEAVRERARDLQRVDLFVKTLDVFEGKVNYLNGPKEKARMTIYVSTHHKEQALAVLRNAQLSADAVEFIDPKDSHNPGAGWKWKRGDGAVFVMAS